MDRPGKDPLELMEELEEVLGIRSVPIVWPIGDGDRFKGVYDRLSGQLHLFDRVEHGKTRAPVQATDLSHPSVVEAIGAEAVAQLRDELELLDVAGEPVDRERIARGELTPLFFGSAVTNFGVELLLNRFIELAPPPSPRLSDRGENPADGSGVPGIRLQDPGQHGPQPPRPGRVSAGGVRPLREGYDRAQCPERQIRSADTASEIVRVGPGNRR